MKIVIANQFHSDNLGDKLIGEALRTFFNKKKVEVVLAGFAQTNEQVVSFDDKRKKSRIKAFFKKITPNFIKFLIKYKNNVYNESIKVSLKHADALVLGGGQLLCHNNVFAYCFLYWTLLAKRHNVPVFVHGIGVNDNLDFLEKSIFKLALSMAKYINCRDISSKEYIREIINKDIFVSPDVVFSMDLSTEVSDNESILIMPYNYDTAFRHFKSFDSRKEYYKMVYDDINNENKVILSATTSDDLEECKYLKEYLDKRGISCLVYHASNVHELLKCYGMVKTIYTGRMHGLILGMILGKRVRPILISRKLEDFSNQYLEKPCDISALKLESIKGLETLYRLINL